MNILDCLENTKKECDLFKDDIKSCVNNPESILTNLFNTNNKSIELLIFTIEKYGEFSLTEFQSQLYEKLMPYLSNFVSDSDISFDYNQDEFGSFIAFYYKEKQIFFIDIYNHKYIVQENEETNKLICDLELLEENINSIKEERKDKIFLMKNPLLLGGANIFKLADIFFNKKKYTNKLFNQIKELDNEIANLNNEKNTINFKIEESNNNFLEISCIQEKLVRKFEKINYIKIKKTE